MKRAENTSLKVFMKGVMGTFKEKEYWRVCNRERSETVGSTSSGLSCRGLNLSLASHLIQRVLHIVFVPQFPPSGKREG